MSVLVDTHLVLWAANEPLRLSSAARTVMDDANVELWFSAASIWEIAIKSGLGRSDFHVDARRLRRGLMDNGWRELSITSEHAAATEDLPPLHRDPFDRMLIAQSHVDAIMLITSDALVAQYKGRVRHV
jgi:PIN domain nuclease of toxin-antitoxin system